MYNVQQSHFSSLFPAYIILSMQTTHTQVCTYNRTYDTVRYSSSIRILIRYNSRRVSPIHSSIGSPAPVCKTAPSDSVHVQRSGMIDLPSLSTSVIISIHIKIPLRGPRETSPLYNVYVQLSVSRETCPLNNVYVQLPIL